MKVFPEEQIESEMMQGGEMTRGLPDACAAFVRAKRAVEHPVDAVLEAPVRPDGGTTICGWPGETGEIVAAFDADFLAQAALSTDEHEAV